LVRRAQDRTVAAEHQRPVGIDVIERSMTRVVPQRDVGVLLDVRADARRGHGDLGFLPGPQNDDPRTTMGEIGCEVGHKFDDRRQIGGVKEKGGRGQKSEVGCRRSEACIPC
jgi:hypothetical protein